MGDDSTKALPRELIEDFLGKLKLYSDGSVVRSATPHIIPTLDDGLVTWTDHLYHQTHDLYLRVYIPIERKESRQEKLPVIVYLHMGGFCFGSRTHLKQHNFCHLLSAAMSSVVVSPDLRLAPEHRLPAAYEDTAAALSWVRDRANSVCNQVADLDSVFILGNSSGGNTCHQLAFKLQPGFGEFGRIRLRGYILLSPFFGGTIRTISEEERPCETFWTLDLYDRLWKLSLPEGSTQDHPYANPFGPKCLSLQEIATNPILVIVGGNEIMKDRVKNYANRLKDMGKNINYVEFEGKEHGFLTTNPFPEDVEAAMNIVKDFMTKNSSSYQ